MTWKADISVWLEKPSAIQVFSDDGQEQDYVPERTCHTIPYNSQAEEYADAWKITAVCSECGWTLETKKGDTVRMHDLYCGGCGAKVVEE